MGKVSERDNYEMPMPYTGEITPEILKKKAEVHAEAEKKEAELKKKHADRLIKDSQ